MRVRPFEDVVAEHGATVLRVCRAVVGPVDAEDAWSNVIICSQGATGAGILAAAERYKIARASARGSATL